MDIERDKEVVDEAISQCKMFIDNGASINVITGFDDGDIQFHQYDMSSIETIIDKLEEYRFYAKYLEMSDFSKEESSMNYYNDMKKYKDEINKYKEESDRNRLIALKMAGELCRLDTANEYNTWNNDPVEVFLHFCKQMDNVEG